jgi:hypothetical protein
MSNHITINDAVDKQLLDDIQHQLILLGQQRGERLESFGTPYRPGKEWLIEYQEHLQTLSKSLAGKSDCKPKCDDDTCPPCFEWNLEQYRDHLKTLRRRTRVRRPRTQVPDAPSS